MRTFPKAGFKDLRSYQAAYTLAMKIYGLTKSFPQEEKYCLSDQIRRSSRSVCANIAEGYRKKRYPKHFISKMTDADAECSETLVWLDFSTDCGYVAKEVTDKIIEEYSEVGRMLARMIDQPEKFTSRQK